MSELDDLTTLVRAATPLMVIETVDEQRVIDCFQHVIAQALYPLWSWTLTEGLQRLDFNGPRDQQVAPDATATLTAIRGTEQRGIYLLFDFMSCLQYPMTVRQVREIVQRENSAAHTLVLVGAKIELPPELEALCTRVPLALPDIKELAGILRGEAAAWQRENNRALPVDNDAARSIVRNLVGLSATDARKIVRKLIYNDGALNADDLPELMKAKFELLNRSGLLHYEYATANFADVAGVDHVRDWVQRRRAVFFESRPESDARSTQGRASAWRAGLRQELSVESRGGRFRRSVDSAGFRFALRQVPGRNGKESARSASQLRGAFTVCAVDRRNRKRSRQRRR